MLMTYMYILAVEYFCYKPVSRPQRTNNQIQYTTYTVGQQEKCKKRPECYRHLIVITPHEGSDVYGKG